MPDGQSPVISTGRRAPDLLFEEEQEARLADIRPWLEAVEGVGPTAPLHRLTVFLTYRCNLDCRYCKTIARSAEELARAPQKRLRHDVASFAELLAVHRASPPRHVHFTGGEAVLLRELADLVRVTKARGVAAVSLTSNGTLPPERYLALVDAGLTELRVSLDAHEPRLGARLTSRPRAFAAAVRTLAALREARAAGRRFTLIINTVVGLENRRRLPALLRFLLRFAPDDVKLITEVDQRDALGAFPELDAVRAALAEQLARLPAGVMPLLRRKLETVFSRDALGLERERAPGDRAWRCYIPLTERTVDRAAYYPCSVYLREGGAPLGPLTDSPEAQREKTAAFVRDARCLEDPICRRYCLHCTRAFNAKANGARR